MDDNDQDLLDEAAAAVADGTPLDWWLLDSGLAPIDRAIADEMRVIAAIAGAHRHSQRPSRLRLATGVADGQILPSHLGKTQAEGAERDFLEALQIIAKMAATPRRANTLSPINEVETATRWGGLELRRKIGAGAFGTVYKAYDPRLERDVAVKLMRQSTAPRSIDVIREARLMARVRHPNVVTVYGAECLDNVVGIWMEYIAGRSLEQIVRNDGPYGPREALLVGIDVARALAAVHAAGLIHSDIKAQNVMRAAGGRTVLMDFGAGQDLLAKADTDNESMSVVGTPLYMAPEVFQTGRCSIATDIYSLGVLLDHLVTRSFPVEARTVSDLRAAHLKQERRLLRDARPDLPAPFIDVVERAIAAEPTKRYTTAGAFEAALASALAACDAQHNIAHIATTSGDDVTLIAPSIRRSVTRRLGLAVTVVMILGASYISTRPTPAPTNAIDSIAVLPLKNESGKPELNYFAEGITDLVTNSLSTIKPLRVASRTSAMRFVGHSGPGDDAARQLSVEAIVTGGVALDGDQVRLSLQVAHAGTNALWSRTYERRLSGMLGLQNEIVRDVAHHLQIPLTAQDVQSLAASSEVIPEAQDAYFRGRHYQYRTSREGAEKAVAFYEEAIRIDPNYAPPYAALATSYIILNATGTMQTAEAMGRARAAIDHALKLGGQSAEVYVALGDIRFMHDWDWTGAEEAYRRALELNPSYAYAYAEYAWFLAARGRLDEALQMMRHAEERDPLSLLMKSNVAGVHYYAHDFDAAITKCHEIVQIDPGFGIAYRRLMQLYVEKAQFQEALAAGRRVLELTGPDPGTVADFARAQALAGNRAEAERLAAELMKSPTSFGRTVSAERLAFVQAALGNRELALDLLQRALNERAVNVPWLMVDPHFDSLRDHSRFPALLQQLDLPVPRR